MLALTAAAGIGAAALTGAALAAKKPTTRALSASGSELAFNVKRLTAPAGAVRLVLTNRSQIAHNVALRGPGLAPRKGRVVGRGKRSTVTVAGLKPGRYTFYCSVFGHEAGGMKGTLTVVRR